MEIQVAAAQGGEICQPGVGRHAGDDRAAQGRLSLVLVDGQHTGRGAKNISNLVARKALSLLAEGVRDGAAARAAHDYLFTQHEGKVQATLTIVSVDLVSETLLLTRNSPLPAYIVRPDGVAELAAISPPVGLYRHTRPVIDELPLEPHTIAVVYTDGLPLAGVRRGETSTCARRWKGCTPPAWPTPKPGPTACWPKPWTATSTAPPTTSAS